MRTVTVIGGGPAGSAAAITARQYGAAVRLYEQSRFPRHKVCGEYLSPEVAPLFEQLGVWPRFQAQSPHRLDRLSLHFPRASKHCRLPESAYGLSRYGLDQMLISEVPEVLRERAQTVAGAIVTSGRPAAPNVRPPRQFGFKAHFHGPSTDSIELFFFDGFYVGVNGVEGGVTNVCGLGPEDALRRYGFAPDELLESFAPLRERTRPLRRAMDWMSTGPLDYGQRLEQDRNVYLAGDALSFIDPYTGSGMLGAMLSGMSAGRSAALGEAPPEHYRRCAGLLRRAYLVSSFFRTIIRSGAADAMIRLVPGRWLVSWTRPARLR